VKIGLAIGAFVVAGAIIAFVMLTRPADRAAPVLTGKDRVVEDFRAVERQAIATYNDAFRRQGANHIDELELALIIERDVLVPWRSMRARVAAARVPPERRAIYETMNRYIVNRELAWQAYAVALQASSNAEARPHYDTYHQKNADAQDDAKRLGGFFRQQGW
jgi:hypothetical protein